MTITKKVGALLLLLTVGSLVGILTFAIFLQRTSIEGLFFVATSNEERLLQQLYVNSELIRDGHNEIRAHQQELIREFDALLNALESGGPNTFRLGPGELMERLPDAEGLTGDTLETAGPEVIRLLVDAVPSPPEEIRTSVVALKTQWLQLRTAFLIVAERPATDPESNKSSDAILRQRPAISQASRDVLVISVTRMMQKRRTMLITLASIAGLSMMLFAVGLLFTRRYIARPIQNLQSASQRIGYGDLSYRVPDKLHGSSDELTVLARTFNSMADQVQRSLERYRELFENAADFVYTADLNGRFMTVNKAAETISGYNRDELLRKTFGDLMIPADAELWRLNQNEISADALNTVREIHILSKDGKSVSLEDSRRPIFENGVLSGIQGVARDVTERNRIKERLDLSNRMEAIGRLAGGIAHDFGNVLTIITGYCTLLRKSIRPDDPLQAEVEGIQKATQRAVSMIRHLLSFSRGQIVNPTLLALDKAISETTSVLRRLIGDKIALVTKVEPRIGHVRMDPTQFEQVLVNLALNARDSMRQGGRIQIDVVNEDVFSPETNNTNNKDGLAPGPYIRLSLTDTGCGMPPDVLSRIFEPFFSTKTQGTGLGLSSVYSIVRQAGGQISAESQPGAGTTMTIHLPRVLEMEAEAKRQTPTQLGRANETILLVEDEVDVRRFVREMLKNEGYNVVEAIDQSHAIAVCGRAEEHIDLVLTDVVMPDMSGPELADRLRGLRPGLKVLFMSGYARDRFEKHRKRGEAIHFIQKPLSSKTLSEKVRGILDGNA